MFLGQMHMYTNRHTHVRTHVYKRQTPIWLSLWAWNFVYYVHTLESKPGLWYSSSVAFHWRGGGD